MSDSAPGQPAFPLRIIIAAPIEEYPEEIRGSADLIIRAGRVLKNRNGVVNTRASDEQILSCEVLELATARGLVGRLHPEPVAGATGKAPADQSGIPGAALTDDPRDRGLSTGPGEGPAEPTPAEVRLLTDSIRSLSRPTEAFLRFPDGTVERIRPVLKDWMGGTPQKPWPDFEWIKPHTRPNPHLDPAYVEKAMDDLASGFGWKGTKPAKGTRRHRIFEAMKAHPEGATPLFPPDVALRLADEVESALLTATITEPKLTREVGKSAQVVDAERSLLAFCEAQEASHADLRTTDKAYTEYHRGAEWAYKILAKRLRGGEGLTRVTGGDPRDAHSVPECTETGPTHSDLAAECREADDRAAAALIRAERAEKYLSDTVDREEALENIAETLAQLDAPEAPTFAQRIQRLFREMREKAEATNVRGQIDRGHAVDYTRVHNLLDGWEIRRETDDGATRSLLERAREFVERLRRTEEDLDTEQHRVAGGRPAPAGDVPDGVTELRVVCQRESHVSERRFIELEDQRSRSLGAFKWVEDGEYEYLSIPYARDDEWVQSVAMAAIVAAQEADQPFPADALDAALTEFGVTPTVPRTWPHREDAPIASMPAFEKALKEIPAHFDDAQKREAQRIFDEHAEPEPRGMRSAVDAVIDSVTEDADKQPGPDERPVDNMDVAEAARFELLRRISSKQIANRGLIDAIARLG